MKCKINNSFGGIKWKLITFIVLVNIASGQNLEEFCTIRRSQVPGHCKLLSDCRQAIDDLRLHGISPQVCRFKGVKPVICCVELGIVNSTQVDVGRTSKQKCQEYRKHSKTLAQLLSPGIDEEECEFLNAERASIGNKAEGKEFPHMTAIGYDRESEKMWLCSGALISKKFVLTAAHCLDDENFGEPKYVRIGDVILDDDYDDSLPQEFNIIETFKHPNFKPPSIYHNIALLKLDNAAIFDLYTLPACLETNRMGSTGKVIVAGWGRENFWNDINSHLLKESFEIFPLEECRNAYNDVTTSKAKNGIEDVTQICVGPRENQNKCVMGTGILQIYSKKVDCMYSIIGVASFSKACGIANIPEVFTRVSTYIGWIENIVWPS